MEPGQDRTVADADGDQDILQVRPSAAVDEERPRHVAGMRLQTMLHGHASGGEAPKHNLFTVRQYLYYEIAGNIKTER